MNEAPQMDPFHPEEAYPEGSFRHFHDAQAGAPGEFETMEEDDEYGDYMGGHHHGPPMGHGGSRVKELKTEIKKESKRVGVDVSVILTDGRTLLHWPSSTRPSPLSRTFRLKPFGTRPPRLPVRRSPSAGLTVS